VPAPGKNLALIVRAVLIGLAAMTQVAGPVQAAEAISPCVRFDAATGRYAYRGSLADWMTCMYPPGSATARNTRLGSVMMPGSHEAGTSALFVSEAATFHYATRCPSPIDRAAQGIPWITRQWAMSQTQDSSNQAAHGSRWFDLRGVLDNYVWRSCDGLVVDRWFDIVDGLVAFHAAHPGEVIVLDIAQLLDPITPVSATRLVEALAPVCSRAVSPAALPDADGVAGNVTIATARAAGGFVLQLSDSPRSSHAFTTMERWLSSHPDNACAGRFWSRRGSLEHVDRRRDANLWINRRAAAAAARRMAAWQVAHVADSRGSFQIARFTWAYAGPQTKEAYQIWLMNHWLVDYNLRLGPSTRDVARGLWRTACQTGLSGNVILLDNITRQRPIRELVAYNEEPCPVPPNPPDRAPTQGRQR